MAGKLAMEIPEVKELVDRFVLAISNHTNGGSIKVGNIKMESRSYYTGNDVGCWRHHVKFLRRGWTRLSDIIVWWKSEFGQPQLIINLRRLKRHYNDIKEAVDSIAIKYEEKVQSDKDEQARLLRQGREKSLREWNKEV